jgi:hypothetical protein
MGAKLTRRLIIKRKRLKWCFPVTLTFTESYNNPVTSFLQGWMEIIKNSDPPPFGELYPVFVGEKCGQEEEITSAEITFQVQFGPVGNVSGNAEQVPDHVPA